MKRFYLVAGALLVMVGCRFDADDDGLRNGLERQYGSDKDDPDSDGDGLLDGEEHDHGTDPVRADSDGDGYTDFEELDYGSDPLDDDDTIYVGGWPYNPAKDELGSPAVEGVLRSGDQVGRYVAYDQFGDRVDLYDFAGHGKPVVLDVAAMNCGPCQAMADWLEGDEAAGEWLYIPAERSVVVDAVDSGDLLWVSVMYRTISGQPATVDDAFAWYSDYPHPMIPVLAAEDRAIADHVGLTGYPSTFLLDSDMKLIAGPSYQTVLTMAQAMLEAEASE